MSKLGKLWHDYIGHPRPSARLRMDAAITEADATIERLASEAASRDRQIDQYNKQVAEQSKEVERLTRERDEAVAVAKAAAEGSMRQLEACEEYRKQRDAALAKVERMDEALVWYETKVANCRKITNEGTGARNALDRDGGAIAAAARAARKEPTDAK